MTTIEKQKISLTTAAAVLIFGGGLIANYFTTLSAVKSGIEEVNKDVAKAKAETDVKITELRGKDELHERDIKELAKRQDQLENVAMTYLSKTPSR